jgi:hypothetical protein
MRAVVLFVVLLVALGLAAPSYAWEPDTAAGIAEQAALEAKLHDRLTRFHGRSLGGYELLAVTRTAAPLLHDKLARLEPASALTPDTRGRLAAQSWLAAGAVLEGMPTSRMRHHFFDPVKKRGLGGGEVSGLTRLTVGKAPALRKGEPAPDWLVSTENDLGLPRFWKELELSATAQTPSARDRHLAFALLGAGAMTSLLADAAVPSRVRLDAPAHLEPLGGGSEDRGSRFERIASLVFGRLGIPHGNPAPRRERLRDFFTAADGKGLADVTYRRWYSPGTLPATVDAPPGRRPRAERRALADQVARTQAIAEPRPRDIDLDAARTATGGRLMDSGSNCLAAYHVDERRRLTWSIPDECALDQLRVILPTAVGYGAGFIDWLFRGELTLEVSGDRVVVRPRATLGAGKLRVFADDASGMRREIGATDSSDGSGQVSGAPSGRITAVFVGVDSRGEAVVAVGSQAR